MTTDPTGAPPPPPPPPPPGPPPPPPPPPPGPRPHWPAGRFSRSRDSRMIAGVFGGLGRATGVDPVLYRVVFGALLVFGVMGHWQVAMLTAFLYLAGWLLLPEDGEREAPVEALLGRGHSSVSRGTTIVLLIGATLALLSLVGNGVGVLVLVAVGMLVYVLMRGSSGGGGAVPGTPPTAGTPMTGTPGPAPAPPATPSPSEAYTVPFAPHGPYAETQHVPTGPPPPPARAPRPPKPPKPPKERSALGRITFSLVLLALGALGLADLLSVGVPASAYVATALAVVALGLLVGTVAGRARGLVFLGILLVLALAITTATERINVPNGPDGDVVWRPTTASDLAPDYQHRFGNALLDLREVPAAGTYRTRVEMGAGKLTVLLPPDLDATVEAHAGVGQLDVLGRRGGGPGSTVRVSDDGPDGPGGGAADLTIEIGAGNVEVKR